MVLRQCEDSGSFLLHPMHPGLGTAGYGRPPKRPQVSRDSGKKCGLCLVGSPRSPLDGARSRPTVRLSSTLWSLRQRSRLLGPGELVLHPLLVGLLTRQYRGGQDRLGGPDETSWLVASPGAASVL